MDKDKDLCLLNDLMNLIAVHILSTLSSLVYEGEDRRQGRIFHILSQKYSFVKKWKPAFIKYCQFIHQDRWTEESIGG